MQLAIGIAFTISAFAKVRDPMGFAMAVVEYEVLRREIAYPLAFVLIALEIFLAITHLAGLVLAMAAWLGLCMLFSFAVGVVVNLRRGRVLACYCFGGREGERISWRTLFRIVALAAGEIFLLAGPHMLGRNQIVHATQTSLVQLGLALFWASLLVTIAWWLFNLSEVVHVLQSLGRANQPQLEGAPNGNIPRTRH